MNDWDSLDIDKIIEKVDEQKRELNPIDEEDRKKVDAAKILKELRTKAVKAKKPKKKKMPRAKLKEGDFRKGLCFAKNCLTCQYYFTIGFSHRGWCHYPSHYPNINRQITTSKDIDRLLKSRGWVRTHPMLKCDLWKRMTHKKLGRALDWTHYDTLPIDGEHPSEDEE
jgi:hypothetical protein